ncbi:MAG: hypothetical protein QM758_16930 [Armatimonas sp.]
MNEGVDTPGPVRWLRSFILAFALILLDAFWVIRAERVGYGPFFSTISLFANVLFLLTIVLLVNRVVKRVLPKQALTRAELMLVYSMVAVGGAIAGQDFASALLPQLSHPYQFGDASNGWLERFGMHLPTQLMVGDTPAEKEALKGFYQGHSSFYQAPNIAAWGKPVLLWSGFIGVLFWTMLCLSVLMRQGWQERERLPFPVVELPLQLTEEKREGGELWKNKLFWIGFAGVSVIEVLNGLHTLYPQIPEINLQHVDVEGQGIFGTHPWNAVGFTCYSFYPFAIGLGYLLPLDLLFSCWFFYLTWKAQLILSRQFSWDVTPDFPFVREQAFGGYLAILVFMLWNGRHYFSEMGKLILKEPSDLDDSQEGISYRAASIGALLGFLALAGFFVWAGMSWVLAVGALAIYFALALAVGRIRAELGPPVHDLHFSGPDHVITTSFGTPAINTQDLTILSLFFWFNRAYRSHPMPFAIEGLKAAKDVRMAQRTMLIGLTLAGAWGGFCALWSYLHLAYDFGASGKMRGGTGFAGEAYNNLNGWISQPKPANWPANGMMLGGFLFCAAMMIARVKLAWWPFHPIGYAISGSWSMNLVWMPLLFAWVIKGAILRYGGVRLYRQAMPIFLGVILGQCLVGSLWHLVSWALDVQPYSFWGG